MCPFIDYEVSRKEKSNDFSFFRLYAYVLEQLYGSFGVFYQKYSIISLVT